MDRAESTYHHPDIRCGGAHPVAGPPRRSARALRLEDGFCAIVWDRNCCIPAQSSRQYGSGMRPGTDLIREYARHRQPQRRKSPLFLEERIYVNLWRTLVLLRQKLNGDPAHTVISGETSQCSNLSNAE